MLSEKELTPAQILQAKMAGIPGDRPGLGGEYPKMLFKKGTPDPESHALASDTNGGVALLPIQGHKDVITMTVDDVDAELTASEQGWFDRIEKALAAGKKAVSNA